jgi:energy-coupling factor transporter ATP-binding protein EcfA2
MRADEITLPENSPIGACSLQGLNEFDLVIVTGANGSGKTTLLSPLDAPGPATGRVSCITGTGERRNYAAQGVQRSITFIRSTQLLEGFRDLSQALCLAANTVRLQHEARLLRQLASHASAAEPAMAVTEPRQITDLKTAYLAADRACAARPRTAAEYNRLGTVLAQRRQRGWTPLDPGVDPEKRIADEAAVAPQYRNLDGLLEFSRAVDALPPAPAAPEPPPSAAARCEAAALALAESIEEGIRELPEGDQPDLQQQIDADAAAVATALQSAAQAMQDALEARDALGLCRAVAARYLRTQIDRGLAVEACPVCTNPIDAGHVCRQLTAAAAARDPEAAGWRQGQERFNALAGRIQTSAVAFNSAREQAFQEHARIRLSIERCATTLQNPVAQHAASVTAARLSTYQHCRNWLNEFGNAAPSSAAVNEANELATLARQSCRGLQAAQHALNEGLAQAQHDFLALQALGVVLAARASLDATPWDLALDAVQASSRRQAQRDRWIKVLTRMADSRQAEVNGMQAEIVKDANMQERFHALVKRIPHPSVQTLQYAVDDITRAGVGAKEQLSEGQTALVNIAATVAVAGKVAEAHGHDPAWIAFDEPTNGLDEAARQQVAGYLGSMTVQDLPLQVFVATFDEEFATQLQNAALGAGRRVRRVRLPAFRPGHQCIPKIEDPLKH